MCKSIVVSAIVGWRWSHRPGPLVAEWLRFSVNFLLGGGRIPHCHGRSFASILCASQNFICLWLLPFLQRGQWYWLSEHTLSNMNPLRNVKWVTNTVTSFKKINMPRRYMRRLYGQQKQSKSFQTIKSKHKSEDLPVSATLNNFLYSCWDTFLTRWVHSAVELSEDLRLT